MVGAMLLMKVLHCKRNVERTRKNCHEDTSHNEEFLAKEIKTEPFALDTCRICLKEGKLAIFGAKASEMCSSIYKISGVVVSTEDPYPKCLCQTCHALLQGALLFRRTALKSEKILNKLQLKTESDEKYESEPNLYQVPDETAEVCDGDANKVIGDANRVVKRKLKNMEWNTKQPKKSKLTCATCEMQYKNKEELSIHRNACLARKKLNIKNKQNAGHESIVEHEEERVTCKICKKTYANKYYKRHVSLHAEESRVFMCDICGKNFSAHSHFSRHRVTHFYDLPFKCSVCPYRGRFTESLRLHMRKHTGEKPYQCEQCPSRFITKSNLNKHTLTHGGHNFRCEVCGKGYYTKRAYDMHIKVDHTGVRDHLCRFCGKSFGYRKQMMKHELKVHKREKMQSGRMPIYLKVQTMKQQNEAQSDTAQICPTETVS